MFGLCRGSHWRVLFAVVSVSVGLAVTPAQGAEPVEPIVGTWVNNIYAWEIQVSGGNGRFIGVEKGPTVLPGIYECVLPAGIPLWSLAGSGLHYSGIVTENVSGLNLSPHYTHVKTLIVNDTCVLGFFPRKFELTLSGAEYSLRIDDNLLSLGLYYIRVTPATAVESVSAKKLARVTAKLAVPKGATVTLRVAPASSEFCSVSITKSGTFLNYLKDGLCKVTVTVNTKIKKLYSKTVTIAVRG